MFKKNLSSILQTIFLIMAIAVCYSFFNDGLSNDDDPFGTRDDPAAWTCPAVSSGCTASGCKGSFRKKCTYTPVGDELCPSENWCEQRF